ncbi:MAG: tetratricopeptide repeat protein [Anaerolineae bacterium]
MTPPTGTVTLLFTDIEGSTKLWERYPEPMKAALGRHDTILRQVIASHQGYVFKTVGDAFCAAFDTAASALAAALDAQRALAAEPWGVTGPIRVRMALHTGATIERDGDYFGQPVNRVARLLSAGYGGQILLSLPTYELVRDDLPPDVSIRDMGEHHLKDLARPEHVFQIVAAGLPADFPQLKTLDTLPNNLPPQRDALIGREKELETLRQMVLRPDVPLLTLTGPGGAGKTRLALQVGAILLDQFDNGVFFVNLAPIFDPELVPSAIAEAIGVREQPPTPLRETLKQTLQDRQMLLILDNFEQVLAAAPIVADLLTLPGLKVLVTSRACLEIRGEHEYPVPPLMLPDLEHLPTTESLSQYEAVRLFIERAVAIRPDFKVTNENAPAIAEICYRLDGLPLAIELAAARIRMLTPAAMLQRLSDPLKLLTGGPRDLPERQQTLRSTIAWSYDLLGESEKALFRRLAVFVGGFSLEAAESVCDVDGDLGIDVLDGVAALVGQSLVSAGETGEGEARYTMLVTLREYAEERLLESSDLAIIAERHARFYQQLAERATPLLTGPEQAKWLDCLEMEQGNFRAALAWSHSAESAVELELALTGSLLLFWWMRGHLTEGWQAATAALARTSADDHTAAHALALHCAGGLAWNLGKLETAATFFEQTVALRRELGDKRGMAQSLSNLGAVNVSLKNFVKARACIEEALAIGQELGDQNAVGLAYGNLGDQAYFQGDLDDAQHYWSEAREIFRRLKDDYSVGIYNNNLGELVRQQGKYAEAAVLFRDALLIFQRLGGRTLVATLLLNLGELAWLQGDPHRAARLFSAAEQLREVVGVPLTYDAQDQYDRTMPQLKAALGDEAFDTAWAAGSVLSQEQAVAYALGSEGEDFLSR